MYFAEALAHQLRGALIMFFLFWSINLFRLRNENHMMKILFIVTFCMCLSFLKDSVYLLNLGDNFQLIDTIVTFVDLATMLMLCIFFCEAVSPGISKSPYVWVSPVCVLVFIPLYLFIPQDWVIYSSYLLTFIMVLATAVFVVLAAIRHSKYLDSHLSCHEHFTVNWVLAAGILFILVFLIYTVSFAFLNVFWIGESIYSLVTLVLWTYLIESSKSHIVIGEEIEDEEFSSSSAARPEEQESVNLQYISELIGPKLADSMQKEQLYLNPVLSLKDVSTRIGSNTKYLSVYLNQCLGVSFYDYINRFRVEKACSIISEMTVNSRVSMPEVAEQSGFNSISSFNRHFLKVMGITPKDYYKNCIQS